MKAADLRDIIERFNRETLGKLRGVEGAREPEPGTASIVGSVGTRCDCFCGKTSRGYTSARDFVSTCLTLAGPNGVSGSVAVGAVIDEGTKGHEEDLSVVLAVGINYSQGNRYLNSPVPVFDATGLLPKIGKVGQVLAGQECSTDSLEEPFHLVAANFFPWITSQPWSSYNFNSIEESAVIFCCGHEDTQRYIRDLISRINPVAVIFHGANNAVAYLGAEVARQSLAHSSQSEFEVIFSDNLAGGLQPGISNAIRLCCLDANRSAMAAGDFDE